MNTASSPFIEINPEMAKAVTMSGHRSSFRLYVAAKSLDRAGWFCGGSGQGLISEAEFISDLAAVMGQTESSIRKQLKLGDGTFWHRNKTAVALRSLDKVADHLGLIRPIHEVVTYPLSVTRGSIRRFTAVLFDAQQPRKSKRICRATQHTFTGISPSTQLRMERGGYAFHHDGRSLAPRESEPDFLDFTGLVPDLEVHGRPNPKAVAAVLNEDMNLGFFARGSSLRRQLPKRFIRGGTTIRRKRRRSVSATTSGVKTPRGSGEDRIRVSIGGRKTRVKPRGFVFIPSSAGVYVVQSIAEFRGAQPLSVFEIDLSGGVEFLTR